MTSPIRCAVYTRKSSEEGLEQSFNSLDAQREACEAFILSQRHEGWQPLSARYDDGGFSGGNMERPGLARLMADITAGKVNTVVVYKVDRLTRSLADFAKIIEQFDAKKVSFVSVTQQFNTTSSMGRLTLNVLLSFAQFEREVTGERIRDKIAASKRKGMWMGGRVPLGYDLRDRKLYINPAEAVQIRVIFDQYLRLGCVASLKAHLDKGAMRSKQRAGDRRRTGGERYSRGALYKLLRNHLYAGEIAHKGTVYAGEHEAILNRETWDRVQALLDQNRQGARGRSRTASGSLLTGLLFNTEDVRFIPTNTQKGGRRYYYYTAQTTIKGESKAGSLNRLQAPAVERAVLARIKHFLESRGEVLDALKESSFEAVSFENALRQARFLSQTDAKEIIRSLVRRVVVHQETLEIQVHLSALAQGAVSSVWPISAPFRHVRQGKILKLVIGGPVPVTASSEAVLKAIARARCWYQQIVDGQVGSIPELARMNHVTPRYVKKILPCAFLAPHFMETLISGTGQQVTLSELLDGLSAQWDRQALRIDLAGVNPDPSKARKA